MTNQEVRQWYKAQVSAIPLLNETWITEGLSAEDRARRAWKIRHDARVRAREMMENPQDVQLLRRRDMKEYGNSDGPTFEFLVARARKNGIKGDKIYEGIVSGSYSTNKDVDRKFDA